MLFNSTVFAIFLPIVLILYWSLRKHLLLQNLLLLFASYVFYMWWDWRFGFLLAGSTVCDYLCARAIQKAREAGGTGKRYMVFSVLFNLGVLGFFKYCNFFVESTIPIWEALGWNPGTLKIILPVGISFYTFQTLSYTVDVYRGKFEARRNVVDVACYVAFFPQLVAGPIERGSRLIPQLEKPRTLTVEAFRMGLMLILVGYIKKVVLADGLAPITEAVYGRVAMGEAVGTGDLLIGTYAFTFQIYGDFSGYSQIARGVAKLLGVELVINFRQPFFCKSITDTWRSGWHISLSTWLRDYLYIPLGGGRGGKARALMNLMITMLLGGLWHGAGWNFVLWGFAHGVYLIGERLVTELKLPWPKGWIGDVPKVFFTFHVFTFALVIFRTDSLKSMGYVLSTMFTSWENPALVPSLMVLGGVALITFLDLPHLLDREAELPAATKKRWTYATLLAGVPLFILSPPFEVTPFFYFQF